MDDLLKCSTCPETDHEGQFCRCESRNIRISKQNRIDGKSEWNDIGKFFKNDNINKPKHYQGNGMEAIDVIESFELDFNLGNAIKYILRAGKKDDKNQDLKKACYYIERAILKEEKGKKNG